MKQMRNYLNNYTISLLVTAALAVTVSIFATVSYEANDDIAITALLKGLFGLAPGVDGIYISPVLGAGLHGLYKLMPTGQWFSVMLYAGLILACFTACLTILEACRGWGTRVAGLAIVVYFFGIVAIQINFGAVSLLLWGTGCAFWAGGLLRGTTRSGWGWAASLQMAWALLLRPDILPIQIAFAAPLAVLAAIHGTRGMALKIFAPFVIVLLLHLASCTVVRSGDDYQRYEQFNRERGKFSDTYQSIMTGKTTQALFAAGWSHEDYFVIRGWWFHDGNVFDSENIRKFLQTNAAETSLFNSLALKVTVNKWQKMLAFLALWLLLFVGWSTIRDLATRKGINVILWFFLLAIVIVLMGIRFPERTAFPCLFILFLSAPVLIGCKNDKNINFRDILSICFIVIFLVVNHVTIKTKISNVNNIEINKKYVDMTIDKVVAKNGNDTIFVDVNPDVIQNAYFPFSENDPLLKMAFLPGGWLVDSPAYLEYLQREGLGDRTSVVRSMIDNPRIVLRYWGTTSNPKIQYESYVKGLFLNHLRQHYNPEDGRGQVDVKVLQDFRRNGNGLIYFQLVTTAAVTKQAGK